MRTRVNFADTAGKTVEAVHEPLTSSLLVTFTDGTYAHIEADGEDIYLNEFDLPTDTPAAVSEAVQYGLMTHEEGAAKVARLDAAKAAAAEARERAEYERLKAKFGG